MGIFSWLFGSSTNPEPEDRERRAPERVAARKISPAMPMAGAGALLSATPKSETEKALDRASENDTRGEA